MPKKRYEVKGMMEWHPEFRVGRSRLQVSFTGGHLCGGASTAASYETSDAVVQAVIESSAAFRRGRIRLVMEGGNSDRRYEGPTAQDGAKSAGNCASGAAVKMTASQERVFEYTKLNDIRDFLQFDNGVPLDRLYSEEDCFREAGKLGVVLKKKDPKP
ncbi:MAG: hypothetical protein K2N25_02840 [Muribaculaceae bacterium]|nr:hypothetical protein [Muribaculaceae bacterium]